MASSEDRSLLERLVTLRGQQESLLGACEPGQFAALSREYRTTLERIEALCPSSDKKGTVLDELNARRAARGSEAPRAGRSPSQAQ